MHYRLTITLLASGVALLLAGCATKGFVREELDKKEAALGQRIGTVEGRVGTEAQRLDRESQRIGKVESGVAEQGQRLDGVGARVTGVEGKAGEAAAAAQSAGTRADAALARANQVDDKLGRLWAKRHARTPVETVDILFGFGRSDLSDQAQTALLNLIKELRENPNLSIDLEGFTDAAGPREYNLDLSQRRVDAVRRFLVEQGADQPRIHAIGLGPATAKTSKGAAAKNRRVTVKLMVAAE